MTALVVSLVIIAAVAIGYWRLEKGPGYGAWYGIAKLTGSRLDIGPIDWATLRRSPTRNDALACPAGLCPNAGPDWDTKTYALPPGDLLARLKALILAEPRTRELAPTRQSTARFIQRTRLMRYPDTIDIETFVSGAGSTLAIYSRSLVGRKDFGVNRTRVERWIAKLDATAPSANP